jgi:UPF0271 protein
MENTIDLNCDLGESYFDKKVGNDSEIIPFISSCNIACGLHGGDPLTIQNTIDLALKYNVNIGAHPSFPDLENFGRKYMNLSAEELKACLRFQIGAIAEITSLRGGKIRHVKPHGALYNAAAKDFELATNIVSVLKEFKLDLCLLGMANSQMEKAAKLQNVEFIGEIFADRNYTDTGELVSRSFDHAIVKEENKVAVRCMKMVVDHKIITENNVELDLKGQSICIHGDTLNALRLVKSIHTAFKEGGIQIQSF